MVVGMNNMVVVDSTVGYTPDTMLVVAVEAVEGS
jgi:hypothetical protein